MASRVAVRHMTSRATFTPVAGAGAYGDVPGTPRRVRCWPEEESKLVRTDSGEETTSSTRLWLEARHYDLAAPGTAVSYGGRDTEVIARRKHSPGAIRLPALLEVALR